MTTGTNVAVTVTFLLLIGFSVVLFLIEASHTYYIVYHDANEWFWCFKNLVQDVACGTVSVEHFGAKKYYCKWNGTFIYCLFPQKAKRSIQFDLRM